MAPVFISGSCILSFLFFVIGLDVWFRLDVIRSSIPVYTLVVLEQFCLIVFMVHLTRWNSKPWIRTIIGFCLFGLLGFIHGVQYFSYSIYGKFISALDISVFTNNFSYWLNHSESLFTYRDFKPVYVSIALFLFYAMLLVILPRWFALDISPYRRRFPYLPETVIKFFTQNTTVVVILFILLVACMKLVKIADARYLEFPVFSLFHQLKVYNRHPDYFPLKIEQKVESLARSGADVSSVSKRGRFNIIVVLNESLRSDHLSMYNYERNTSPNMDALFDSETYLFNTVSNSTGTEASLSNIFTGLDQRTSYHDQLRSPTIWPFAKQAGYTTFYVSSQWLEWNGGIDRFFLEREYIDFLRSPTYTSATLGRDDMITARIMTNVLHEMHNSDRPFFGVLHFSNTHFPYTTDPENKIWRPAKASFDGNDFQMTINQYDNSILQLDRAFGHFIDKLSDIDEMEETIIIMTSDHGEGLYEHGQFFHGKVFWQEGIQVPLAVYIPDSLKPMFEKI